MYKILIVEEDINISEMVTDYLSGEGYEVLPVYTGESAISALEQESYDLALIDLMLPGCSGFEVVKSIRKKSVMPVIIITAKDNDIDKTRGLNLGADDYVTKPFGIMELLSRIRSVLRRSGKSTDQKGELLSFGTIRADRNRHVVTVDEKEVAVTLKEFQLLCYLLLNKGIVLSREQIMQAVWDIPFEMESRTIDMHIMSLRQKLGGEGAAIRTIRGVGYRLGEREK